MIPAGETFLVYWKGTAFMAQLSADFSSTGESRDTSHKQSGIFSESAGSRIGSTISLTAYFDTNATADPEDIWDDYQSRQPDAIKLSQEDEGGYEIAGDARIDGYSMTTPDQENVELSLEFTFTGPHSIEKIS